MSPPSSYQRLSTRPSRPRMFHPKSSLSLSPGNWPTPAGSTVSMMTMPAWPSSSGSFLSTSTPTVTLGRMWSALTSSGGQALDCSPGGLLCSLAYFSKSLCPLPSPWGEAYSGDCGLLYRGSMLQRCLASMLLAFRTAPRGMHRQNYLGCSGSADCFGGCLRCEPKFSCSLLHGAWATRADQPKSGWGFGQVACLHGWVKLIALSSLIIILAWL